MTRFDRVKIDVWRFRLALRIDVSAAVKHEYFKAHLENIP